VELYVAIYWGSVSDFGKIPVPDHDPNPEPDPGHIKQFVLKIFNKILHFQCYKQHCFPESCHLTFTFFTSVFCLMSDPDPNPSPEPECMQVPVQLKQKIVVPTVPVPQQWAKDTKVKSK
jgi:hypothetical protein